MRYCLRDPISETEVVANLLSEAVDAHLRGERGRASALFARANDPAVRSWLDSVWGKATRWNTPLRVIADPPALPKEMRGTPRDATAATKLAIHARDGWYCRHCHIPVIRGTIRRAVHELYPMEVPWDGTNLSQHAGFAALWAQYDHVLPHARGGSSGIENVYLTCAACNYGRGNFLLEEFGLEHPSTRARREGPWDGLERFAAASAAGVTSGRPVLIA